MKPITKLFQFIYLINTFICDVLLRLRQQDETQHAFAVAGAFEAVDGIVACVVVELACAAQAA